MTVRLLDLEGTVCPVAFVHEVLFPWARERLPEFIAAHADDPRVRACIEAVAREVPGVEPAATLLAWMDEDRKARPLKELQGLIWRTGWEAGAFVTPLFPGVVGALTGWRAAGDRIAVYSSGSVEAQRLLLAHTNGGDLRGFVSAWFDTAYGPKRDPVSYGRIAAALGVHPRALRFYTDDPAEMAAAQAAGVPTVHVGVGGLRDEAA